MTDSAQAHLMRVEWSLKRWVPPSSIDLTVNGALAAAISEVDLALEEADSHLRRSTIAVQGECGRFVPCEGVNLPEFQRALSESERIVSEAVKGLADCWSGIVANARALYPREAAQLPEHASLAGQFGLQVNDQPGLLRGMVDVEPISSFL